MRGRAWLFEYGKIRLLFADEGKAYWNYERLMADGGYPHVFGHNWWRWLKYFGHEGD